MFCPTDLVCSIQGSFNQIETIPYENETSWWMPSPRACPRKSRPEIPSFVPTISSLHLQLRPRREARRIVLEPKHQFSHQGIMTSFGYCLPDPGHSNRLRVCLPAVAWSATTTLIWNIGRPSSARAHQNRRKISSRARVTMAKVALGAHPPEECGGLDDDGTISFTLHRPMAAWVDVLYMDSNMRCAKSQNGTVYMFARIPN